MTVFDSFFRPSKTKSKTATGSYCESESEDGTVSTRLYFSKESELSHDSSHCASFCSGLIPSHLLDVMTSCSLCNINRLSPSSSHQLQIFEAEQAEKRLSVLCEQEHLLCFVKYLQQKVVGGQWMASDLRTNNLSEDNAADPPMLGSLLLEGI